MAEDNVRIEPGGCVLIDVNAWVSLRTAGIEPTLTAELHEWAGHRAENWSEAAQGWSQDQGYDLREPDVITHGATRLDASAWVLLATAGDGRRLAVVGIDHDPPTIYLDTTLDPWWWYDADSVVITCLARHSWTWRSGREVLTVEGRPATLTTVFGPSLDAPFTICPDCTAFHLGSRQVPCDCDRSPWILCPTCGQRCSVDLPRP
jgi:hypothetical protein